jgi:uracil phosphoribosyltransferase
MGNVNIINHPLVKHKITLMRDEKTGTREFRILVEEVAMLMGYEAMRDLPTEDVEVKTPITTRKLPMLCGKKLAIVPILRAGLGMVSGLLALVPSAKVGHIGLYRDEVTHEPHEYYCKLPDRIRFQFLHQLFGFFQIYGQGKFPHLLLRAEVLNFGG